MRHVVVMQKIQLQRADVFFGRAGLEPDVVVDTDVVHKNIEAAEFAESLLHDGGAILGWNHVGRDEQALCADTGQLFVELAGGFHIFVYKNRDSALPRAAADNGRANSLPAASDEDDLVFKLQVHVSPLSIGRS